MNVQICNTNFVYVSTKHIVTYLDEFQEVIK